MGVVFTPNAMADMSSNNGISSTSSSDFKRQLEDSTYMVLSEIQTSMNLEDDYEYPVSLDQTPRSSFKEPRQDRSERASTSPVNQRSRPGSAVFYTQLSDGEDTTQTNLIPPTEDSDTDYSDVEGGGERVRDVIKQVNTSSVENDSTTNDDTIPVEGNLVENRAPLSFKSRLRSASQALTDSLANQGIYQGLVMTDTDKQRLGILPESIYMTTNLLQNFSEEIEKMEVDDEVGPEVIPRCGSKTDPTITVTKIKRHERASAPQIRVNSSTPRPVTPRYRNHIVRPPPLPPLIQLATIAERKAYSVVESLLKSEASLLSSLHVAIEVYMNPLREMSLGPIPILNQQQVAQLFGPIENILTAQELFYSALTSRTLAWSVEQKIGDVFLSSLATKEVIRQYSAYVNNFTAAISVLEQGLNKKARFKSFIQDRYQQSNTSLSLQGLLLKPIQRFPQYIMFIQDLLKYTSHTHPDRITLQMALARFEGIADYLNESKRTTEQRTIVEHLNNRVSKLPFKLTDAKQRRLHRQDVVTRLYVSGTKVAGKKRCLLLFNNMVLCAAPSRRRSRQAEMESTTGSRLFRAVDGSYTCKWYAPVDQFMVVEPDYHNDIWDQFVGTDVTPANVQDYTEAKTNYRKLEHDFNVLAKIASSISTLYQEYEGLTMPEVSTHTRVLQRKLAKMREHIKSHQTGRLDISIPSRDGSKRVSHTYMFQSEEVKLDWISALRYTKLKLNKHNTNAWVTSEDTNDEDFFDLSHKLPLFVESYRMSMNHNLNSVQCAARVGTNSAWLASGDHTSAQITIVECVTPAPLILESFHIDSSRIMDILYVPPVVQSEATLTATMRRVSMRDTLKNMGSLTSLPPHLATVWLGAECGRLTVYSAVSIDDGSKKHLASVKFNDAITTLQYHKDQVIVSTAEGSIVIFQRKSVGWNLDQRKTIQINEGAIRCTCLVKTRLWIGTNNLCFFLNLQTHRVEGSLVMSSKPEVMVSRMVSWGEGVWVSFKGSSSLELFHTVTKTSLQHIDIKSTLNSIIKRRDLSEKFPIPEHVHVTALMASSGYFWIGTSVGIIMVYRIPLIEGVPLVTAKPYLSMDGHKGPVRVILTVHTQATMSSTRVNQFLSAEQRSSAYRYSALEEESVGVSVGRVGRGVMEEIDGDSLSPVESPAPHEIEKVTERQSILYGSGQEESRDERLDKSTTPSLPNPNTFQFEASVYDDVLYTPEQSYEESVFDGITTTKTEDQGGQATNSDIPPQMTDASSESTPQVEGSGSLSDSTQMVNGETGVVDGPVYEIPETSIEDSIDSGQNHYEFSEDFNNPATVVECPLQSDTLVHNVQDLQECAEYIDPTSTQNEPSSTDAERSPLVRKDTVETVKKHRAKDIYIEESDSFDYNTPHELDAVTMRRVPSDELIAKMKEIEDSSKDDDGSAFDKPMVVPQKPARKRKPSPYEDPATLERTGPLSANQLFSSTLVRGTSPSVPGRTLDPKGGAIFVLTAGRGLVDLRHGAKINVLFPTAKSSACLDDKGEEGCMIAYEIEH